MLHRYGGNIEYVLNQDIEVGLALMLKAKEKERDEHIFQQWAAQLPVMAMGGQYMSYEDYHTRVTGANIDLRPTAELLKELDAVEAEFEKGGGSDGDGNIQADGLDICR